MVEAKCIVTVPKEAVILRLKGVDWGGQSPSIVGAVDIEKSEGGQKSIASFIDEIPRDDYFFIIDTTAPPLGHKTLALRPNNLSFEYEKMGIWVVFIPFSSIQDQPRRVSKRVMQVNRSEVDLLIDRSLKKRNPEKSFFICSSFSSFQSLTSVYRFKTAGWHTIYECRDDMEEFNRVGYSKWYSPALEREVIRSVDFVISVSPALNKKLSTLICDKKSQYIVPNAVNSTVIETSKFLRSKEAFRRRQGSTVVGYVGHLTKAWFDWDLLIAGARRLPEVTFQIVGHGAPEGLILPNNIGVLGPKSHEELQRIVCDWKVGIIPFLNIPLTRAVDPNKIYEYMAWGLRCVSAPMGMVEQYPSTKVYYNLEGFLSAISSSLSEPYTDKEIDTLNNFVLTCSWENRAKQMCKIMGVNYVEAV